MKIPLYIPIIHSRIESRLARPPSLPLVALHPLQQHLLPPPKQPQAQRQRRHSQRQHGRKHQRPPHIERRVPARPVLQRVGHDDEDAAQQLAAAPAERARHLGRDGVRQLDQELDRHGDQAEGRRARDAQDDVRPRQPPRGGHPDKGQERQRQDGHEDLDGQQEGLCPVEDRGRDGRGHEADDDEQGARDAGVGVRVAVGLHDLVEEGGDGVEEADVDGEGDEDEPELEVGGEDVDRLPEGELGGLGGWRGRGRGGGGDEEGGDGADG